ncbi:MAG: 4Fe-4S dicluster domain-containing protein [Clostridia bacterium]|nr:4Fe-4S dicluster domain-containing protein [Clostridia bacterium]
MSKRIHGGIDFEYEFPQKPDGIRKIENLETSEDRYEKFWDRTQKTIDQLTPEDLVEECKKANIIDRGEAFADILERAKDKVRRLVVTAFDTNPHVRTSQAYATFYPDKIISAMIAVMTAYKIKSGRILIAMGDTSSKNALRDSIGKKSDWISIKAVNPVYPSEKSIFSYYLSEDYELSPLRTPEDAGTMIITAPMAVALADSLLLGKPMNERLITISTPERKHDYVVLCPTGTEINIILPDADYEKQAVFENGVVGGNEIDSDFKVSSSTNSITVIKRKKAGITDCIGCAKCSDICPLYLNPYKLLKYSKTKKSAEKANLCLECMACDYVCPSRIPIAARIKKIAEKNRESEAKND